MKTIQHKDYTATIKIHHNADHGAPWEENDGHGIVSEWTSRDKKPSERVLSSDRSSYRYYDFALTVELAKKDGWGLGNEDKMDLAKRLGRNPTRKEIIAQAVEQDFDYLRGWCNDEWTFQGYTTEIETPDGETIDGDSCWGYEGTDAGQKYMLGEAESSAIYTIEKHLELVAQTEIAACIP